MPCLSMWAACWTSAGCPAQPHTRQQRIFPAACVALKARNSLKKKKKISKPHFEPLCAANLCHSLVPCLPGASLARLGGNLMQDSPGVGMISAGLGFHDDLCSIPGARTVHTCTPQDATTWEIGGGIATALLSHCWLVFIDTGKACFGMLIIYFVNQRPQWRASCLLIPHRGRARAC